MARSFCTIFLNVIFLSPQHRFFKLFVLSESIVYYVPPTVDNVTLWSLLATQRSQKFTFSCQGGRSFCLRILVISFSIYLSTFFFTLLVLSGSIHDNGCLNIPIIGHKMVSQYCLLVVLIPSERIQ